MQNRNSLSLAELRQQLDDAEQWRQLARLQRQMQLAARADRRRWLALIVGVVLLGILLYYGGLL